MDLNLSITNGEVSSKIYVKRYNFDLEVVNHFSMEMFPAPLPMVYLFRNQLINFARVCSNFDEFNNNLLLTAMLLKQGYRYH